MAEPIKVATDGGCWPNPGPGGWAWVAQDGRYEAGSFGAGTNNVAELLAIRHALLAFPDEPIEIVYDSQYAANSVTQWGPSWRRRGITEKANIELIFEIVDIHQSRPEHARVLWTHVRGHRGHDLNEQADQLASRMVQMPDGHHETGDLGQTFEGEFAQAPKTAAELRHDLVAAGVLPAPERTEPSAHMRGVMQFHQVYGHPVNRFPTTDGVTKKTGALRVKLIREELTELRDAIAADDVVEIADALGDLLYVVTGAALVYGIDLDAVFDEVQRSNMSKLGADGRPVVRADGKILKGPDFTEPDIRRVLDEQQPLF